MQARHGEAGIKPISQLTSTTSKHHTYPLLASSAIVSTEEMDQRILEACVADEEKGFEVGPKLVEED